MPFQRLFTVVCMHQYFASQPCGEVWLQPTHTCSRLMQRYGLLFRQEGPGTISVLRQQAAAGKNIIPSCTEALNFSLQAKDASFFTYTKTAQSKANMLLYSNAKKPKTAALEISEIEKWKENINSGGYSFGGVSIVPPAQFQQYTCQLETLAVPWQYYLVPQKMKAQYRVDGTAAGITFQPVTDAGKLQASSTYQSLLRANPDTPLFWYQSETPLPLAKQARPKIQLVNTDTQTVLFDDLPNPTPTDNGIKVIYL